MPGARTEPVTAKLSANAPGKVDAEISTGETTRVKLAASGVAVESLAPLLRRLDPDLALAGSLTADVTATWGKDAAGRTTATVDGTLGVKNLALAGPWLGGDTLRLASADLPLRASVAGRAVRVERADFTSDVGTLSVAGAFDPDEPLDKLLERPGAKIDATVDLAKLAATLPKLLRVRGGPKSARGSWW